MKRGRAVAWAAALCLAAGAAWFAPIPWTVNEEPSPGGGAATTAALLNEKGVRLFEAGDIDGAIGLLRQARSRDRHDETIARNLSTALLGKASAPQGADDGNGVGTLIEEALAAWPENPEALDRMSAIHYRAGRYRQAWDLATRLAAFDPERPGIGAYVQLLERRLREEEGLSTEAGERFRVRYNGERRLEFEGALVAAFQGEIDALTASIGIFPEDPIEILVLTEELGKIAAPADRDVTGVYDGRIRLYIGRELPPREEFLKVVRHELAHAILQRAGQAMPVWFQEGVSQMLGEAPSEARLNGLREALAEAVRRGWRMESVETTPSFMSMPREDRALAYAASLAFVTHLVERHGRNLVPVAVAEMARGAAFEEALRTATGSDLPALREEFMRTLEKG